MVADKQKRIKRWLKAFQIALVLVSAVVVFGNGCAEGGFYPEGGDDSASTLEASCKDPNEIDVIPGAKTAALVGSTNIVQHLSACIGLESISTETRDVYDAKVGSVSTYGAVNALTPPMMMAVHSIAGEVCNDLIDQELARGTRIFAGWSLAADTIPTSAEVSTAATNLALSCWRDYEISEEERSIILDSVSGEVIAASDTNKSRKAAVILCTAMLSSLNALLN